MLGLLVDSTIRILRECAFPTHMAYAVSGWQDTCTLKDLQATVTPQQTQKSRYRLRSTRVASLCSDN
jgi:hypothetical protein